MTILSKRLRAHGGCCLRTAAHLVAAMILVIATFAAPLFAAVLIGPAASASDLASHSATPARGQEAKLYADASPGAPVPASPSTPVKYCIVPPARNGHKGFLFEIAATTLGSGDLDTEIFNLNKGRLEPGGARFVNPTVIQPGWILELPPNASGPDVHFGPLPTVTAHTRSGSRGGSQHARGASAPSAGSHMLGSRGVMVIGAALIILIALAGLAISVGQSRRASGGHRASADGATHLGPEQSSQTWVAAIRRWQSASDPRPMPTPGDQPDTSAVPDVSALPDLSELSAATPQLASPLAAARTLPGPYEPTRAEGQDGLEVQHGFVSTADLPATSGAGDLRWPDYLTSLGHPSPSLTGDPGSELIDQDFPADVDTGSDASRDELEIRDELEAPDQMEARDELEGPDPDATDLAPVGEMSAGLLDAEPSARSEPAEPANTSQSATPQDNRPGTVATPEFSPVALRLLGAQRSSAQRRKAADVPAQSHEVAFGDDRIKVVLTEAPVAAREGKARTGHSWLAATPYLVWAPLPYDAPDDGVAFACLGAWEEGCLFIDLGAAPGAVAIGGDEAAASRLAESLAHQLCTGPASSRTRIVVVGDVLPAPNPPGADWIASLDDLGSLPPPGADEQTELVFCRLRSNDDAFPLARYVASARRRVVPVTLANLPDAPWSFTAQLSRRAANLLQPVIA